MLLHLIATLCQSPRRLALFLSSSLSSSASVQCGLAPIPSSLHSDQKLIKHRPAKDFDFGVVCSVHISFKQPSLPADLVCVTLIIAILRILSVCSLVGCCTADSSLHTRTSSHLPMLVGVFLGCVSHSEASLAYQRLCTYVTKQLHQKIAIMVAPLKSCRYLWQGQ